MSYFNSQSTPTTLSTSASASSLQHDDELDIMMSCYTDETMELDMDELFSPADLDHQNRLRQAFDPACRANPGKVLPMGHSCADIQALREMPTGVWG